MPLGQHLSAQQNAGLAFVYLAQHGIQSLAAAGGVTVYAQHGYWLEHGFEDVLQLLGAGALGLQLRLLASRADPGQGRAFAAMMTAQTARHRVHSHIGYAVLAFAQPAAVGATEHRGKAPPIDKHQHLVALPQMTLDAV